MRVLSEPPHAPEGFALMAECHGCERIERRFLVIDNDHGSLMVLCGYCILAIATAWTERYPTEDSQA